ncbi:hypothetical protein ACQCT6_20940 [Cytobacillus gottheilii]|uniref:hypothetical protein n=1 Tax=Cytobacillus gottheilii TaxID=859144 RepID=UPI002494CB69|nr:hypothetical protein [Cytobacillus gottheilii]
MKDIINIQYQHSDRADCESRTEFNRSILRYELNKYKKIKIPTMRDQISGPELAEWLIEIASPKELDKFVFMIRHARQRNSNTKAIFEIAAAALIPNVSYLKA